MLRWPTLLYNTLLQHSSPTLLSNTLPVQHFSPTLFHNTLLQHFSATLFSDTSLQHSSPTLLYNASLQNFSCHQQWSLQSSRYPWPRHSHQSARAASTQYSWGQISGWAKSNILSPKSSTLSHPSVSVKSLACLPRWLLTSCHPSLLHFPTLVFVKSLACLPRWLLTSCHLSLLHFPTLVCLLKVWRVCPADF